MEAMEKVFLSILEKKEKKENAVVIGLPESDELTDQNQIQEMARHAGIIQPEFAIKTTFRDGIAGKRRQNGEAIPRIVKVKFFNKEHREKIFAGQFQKYGDQLCQGLCSTGFDV
jgi:hypothetical protein